MAAHRREAEWPAILVFQGKIGGQFALGRGDFWLGELLRKSDAGQQEQREKSNPG